MATLLSVCMQLKGSSLAHVIQATPKTAIHYYYCHYYCDGLLPPKRRHTIVSLKSKGPFTLLRVSNAVARLHMSAAGVIQRYHLYHQCECE